MEVMGKKIVSLKKHQSYRQRLRKKRIELQGPMVTGKGLNSMSSPRTDFGENTFAVITANYTCGKRQIHKTLNIHNRYSAGESPLDTASSNFSGTSLAVQRWDSELPLQALRVWPLVRELKIPACHTAQPKHHHQTLKTKRFNIKALKTGGEKWPIIYIHTHTHTGEQQFEFHRQSRDSWGSAS